MTAAIRAGRDADAAGIIRLIGDCWSEYPGCVLDVDGELPELRALASWFAQAGGHLWVADSAQGLAGMVGVRPRPEAGAWEICRLYVDAPARGGGLAQTLLDAAEGRARAAGAEALVLWTDTRFARAHGFYEKRGYLRQGPIRVLDDVSHSLEFRYAKPARGIAVEALDAAAAASAERGLGRLLVDAVAPAGALPAQQPTSTQAFWRGVSAGVARGGCVLLVAWHEGDIAGSVQLDLDVAHLQPHRAAMSVLLLDPARDPRAVGAALLSRVEDVAAARGKALITCELPADDIAATLCRAAGWHQAGRIPGGRYGSDARWTDTLIFWKSIGSGMLAMEASDVGRE